MKRYAGLTMCLARSYPRAPLCREYQPPSGVTASQGSPECGDRREALVACPLSTSLPLRSQLPLFHITCEQLAPAPSSPVRGGDLAKRFNNGQASSYGLRKAQHVLGGAGAAAGPSSTQRPAVNQQDALLVTDSHAVVRAGAVPAGVVSHASSARHCSARVFCHG